MTHLPPQPKKPQICAIVPTYNEELNIRDVLSVLEKTMILDEIILVDDGSIDHTLMEMNKVVMRDPRFRILHHEKNLGKGQAIFSGWAVTSAPILLLLDADLKSLSLRHIEDLINPILEKKADMTMGLFQGGHFMTTLSHHLTPFLTGQRGLRSELIKYMSPEAAAGYGFEVALTIAARQQNYRTKVVPLKGVWHPSSEFRTERGGFWKGGLWRYRMFGQILRAWYLANRHKYSHRKTYFSNLGKP